SFSERGNHAAIDEYVSRHGSHLIPFQKRFHQPKNSFPELSMLGAGESEQKKTGRPEGLPAVYVEDRLSRPASRRDSKP
ncbi:hypothetical protein ACCS64_39985, partial [Rhizobium ruizarguesonis]